mmetsp:Transcript_23210/g.22743  ORF Transcript_23210/g.22743 Transcript_23210/m.22743 type:complete len:109 (+) Transcript_23210:439-765(+)
MDLVQMGTHDEALGIERIKQNLHMRDYSNCYKRVGSFQLVPLKNKPTKILTDVYEEKVMMLKAEDDVQIIKEFKELHDRGKAEVKLSKIQQFSGPLGQLEKVDAFQVL